MAQGQPLLSDLQEKEKEKLALRQGIAVIGPEG